MQDRARGTRRIGAGRPRVGLVAVLALVGGSLAGAAQEGHPLTGTWSGDWGPSATDRHHLTVVMRWDGERVSGLINPGPDSVPIDRVVVDFADWTVRLDAEARGQSGAPEPVSARGRLEDIGSSHRTLTGTWRQGTLEGDFTLTRD